MVQRDRIRNPHIIVSKSLRQVCKEGGIGVQSHETK